MPSGTFDASYSASLCTCIRRYGYLINSCHFPDVANPIFKPTPSSGNDIIYARRASDGLPVVIKVVGTKDDELKALRLLSSEPLASDPRNHCIRMTDFFPADDCEELGQGVLSFVVFPVYGDWHDPPMHLVAEVVPFMHQLLEGLLFLHCNNIAHGDIKSPNILVDPSSVSHIRTDPNRSSTELSCSRPSGARYFYIDFGSCTVFDSYEARRPVQVFGGTFRLPENPPCIPRKYLDAFKADIWLLGNMFNVLYNTQVKIPELDPLIRSMHSRDPDMRPSAQDCFEHFCAAVNTMCWSHTLRLPNAALIIRYGNNTKKWPGRRAEDAREYLQHLVQLLVQTNGTPRVSL